MPFDWNEVAAAPAVDEIEVATFGPGFGECTLIHTGWGRWVIVDSCVDSEDKSDPRPVAEKYLRALGVDLATQVDIVVATHWHSDHVRGIGRLVEQCSSAAFSCATTLVQQEFTAYVEEMSTGALATDGAKVSDFRKAIGAISQRGTPVKFALGNRVLKTWSAVPDAAAHAELRSLSPSDLEVQTFLTNIAAERPRHGEAKRSAAPQDPNLCSVVLKLITPDFSVLLGADMETHHNPGRGWTAVLQEAQQSGIARSAVFKVPHHGSSTGHHDGVWTDLLVPSPISGVAPFNRLPDSAKLPTEADLRRIRPLSSALYATAPTRSPPARALREAAVEKSLRESAIVIRPAASRLGMVRLRRRQGTATWSTALFGAAHTVPAFT